MLKTSALLALLGAAAAHDDDFPINPALGVPGFPDCINPKVGLGKPVEEAAMDLVCSQRAAPATAIKIGCVGDSITAGVHSSGGNHTYPGQLQILLDSAYGADAYSVTNLGACGSTMLKKSNSPYWARGQYKTLTASKWDVIVIMLGTNDAKDKASGGPANWLHDCTHGNVTSPDLSCSYAQDYKSMIEIVRTLGTTSAGPKIFTMVPPPLMAHGSIGANQSVINDVFPHLVPAIGADAKLGTEAINVYAGMGGEKQWRNEYPSSCQLVSTWPPCEWWCDKQSCDQCHPNNDGYHHMANIVMAGLGLPTPPSRA